MEPGPPARGGRRPPREVPAAVYVACPVGSEHSGVVLGLTRVHDGRTRGPPRTGGRRADVGLSPETRCSGGTGAGLRPRADGPRAARAAPRRLAAVPARTPALTGRPGSRRRIHERAGDGSRHPLLVPVGLRVAVQGREHDGQDLGRVVADQAHDVLVVPVVQGPLRHLEDRARTPCARQVSSRHPATRVGQALIVNASRTR